jgi:hypothetical protein
MFKKGIDVILDIIESVKPIDLSLKIVLRDYRERGDWKT